MFPYRDNLTGEGQTYGVVLLIAVLTAVNVPLFFHDSWHAWAVAHLGFTPLRLAVEPFVGGGTLVTSVALHGDIFHLAGNCLFLWVFGRSLERLLGRSKMLAMFPTLGIVGLLLHWALYPASNSAVIGASGAVAAMMGAYLPLFPDARIRMVVFFGWFWRRITVPAWAFLFYWAGLQLLSVALGSTDRDGIAYAVHVGSFLAGVIAAIAWKTSFPYAEEKLLQFSRASFQR